MYIDWTEAGRDALDHALTRAPEHFACRLRPTRDEGCAFVFVSQGRKRFDVPSDRPAILLIGDNLNAALGPGGFEPDSLRTALARCHAAAIVVCEPLAKVYQAAAIQ